MALLWAGVNRDNTDCIVDAASTVASLDVRIRRTIIDLQKHMYESFGREHTTQPDLSDNLFAMTCACAQGLIGKVSDFLSSGSYSYDDVYLSLLVACAFGQYNVVQCIVRSFERPIPPLIRKMMVIQAASHGHTDTLKQLLDNCDDDRSALIGPTNDPLQSPLCLAAWRGHLSIVYLLCQYDEVDVNEGDNMVMFRAAMAGHIDVVMILLQFTGLSITSKWPQSIVSVIQDALYVLFSIRKTISQIVKDLARDALWRKLPIELQREIISMSHGNAYASRSIRNTSKHLNRLMKQY